MKCQHCDDDLPGFPRDAVEDDVIDEVVAHIRDPDGIGICETLYYCDPDCAAAAWGDA